MLMHRDNLTGVQAFTLLTTASTGCGNRDGGHRRHRRFWWVWIGMRCGN